MAGCGSWLFFLTGKFIPEMIKLQTDVGLHPVSVRFPSGLCYLVLTFSCDVSCQGLVGLIVRLQQKQLCVVIFKYEV